MQERTRERAIECVCSQIDCSPSKSWCHSPNDSKWIKWMEQNCKCKLTKKKNKTEWKKTHTITNTKTMRAIITVHSTYLRSPSQKVFKFPPQTHLHLTKTAGSQPFLYISFGVYGCLNSPTISERRSIGSTYVYDKLTDGQQINLLFAAVRMYVCMYVWIDVYVAPPPASRSSATIATN